MYLIQFFNGFSRFTNTYYMHQYTQILEVNLFASADID